jgi:DNA-binding GntR family transcriptional regulator
MCGRFAPGEHLEPVAIGEELHSSITPVRDALHRLVGERLVEAPRNDGFRVPLPTEAELRDLYRWNRDLAELGLRRPAGKTPADLDWVADNAEIADVAAYLFRHIARRSGNPELEIAVEAASDRLASMRHVEARFFDDAAAEIERLRVLLTGDDLAALRRGIIAYHKRRQRAVPDLLIMARQRRDRA